MMASWLDLVDDKVHEQMHVFTLIFMTEILVKIDMGKFVSN